MAKQTKSTHQAHCQVCGRLQAVMAVGGMLAKHGYTVKGWGYFKGVCQGSDTYPLEQDRTLTDSTCKALTEYAADSDRAAEGFRTGKQIPLFCTGDYDRAAKDYKRVDWADATEYQRTQTVNRLVWSCENEARAARAHVEYMQKLAQQVHGTDLLPIKKVVHFAPAAPSVDTKAGKVTGVYATKAARQADLDKLSRRYETLRYQMNKLYLATPRDQQTKEATAFYYGVQSLSQWRPKHSALALKLYPQAAELVQEIEELAKTREAIKNA